MRLIHLCFALAASTGLFVLSMVDRFVTFVLDAIPSPPAAVFGMPPLATSIGTGDQITASLSHSLRHEAGVRRYAAARNV